MRCVVAFAAAVTFATALPVTAQEFKPPANLFGQKKPAPRPPSIDWSWRPSAGEQAPSKPAVICGMTVVPADPSLDVKMKVATPERGVTFTMRAVPPTICKAP